MINEFYKMQSSGNDYVYIFGDGENYPELSVKLSDRRFGVGGDGLIVIRDLGGNEIGMRIFNADGSEGDTCGNGLRCAAFLSRKYLGKGDEITVVTRAGQAKVVLSDIRPHSAVASADTSEPKDFPLPYGLEEKLSKVGLYADKRQYFSIDTGNKHLVFFADSDIEEIKRAVEEVPAAKGVYNIEKAVFDGQEAVAEVIERGSGRTLSCGSGTIAVAYAVKKKFGYDGALSVRMPGGAQTVSFVGGRAVITGIIKETFSGEYYI